jgi:hypothetical protein
MSEVVMRFGVDIVFVDGVNGRRGRERTRALEERGLLWRRRIVDVQRTRFRGKRRAPGVQMIPDCPLNTGRWRRKVDGGVVGDGRPALHRRGCVSGIRATHVLSGELGLTV